jgi:hypothetical protein
MLAPAVARADPTDACIAAAEAAQPLRKEGHLKAARERLLLCSRDECPDAVRRDCSRWLSAMEGVVPTVIIRAVDGAGTDLVDVRVSIDGGTVATRLDGKGIEIDPGEHVLRLERPGSAPVEQTLVVREAEQHRIVSVTFRVEPSKADRSDDSAAEPRPPAPSPEATASRSLVGPIALLGGGAALLGIASYLWVSGNSDHATMQSTCAATHTCSQSAVDSAHGRLVAGDVLGVSGALVVALGAGWLLLGQEHAPVHVGLGVGPRAAALGVQGSF